eukprot:3137383-Prymnesium_polylepis.2
MDEEAQQLALTQTAKSKMLPSGALASDDLTHAGDAAAPDDDVLRGLPTTLAATVREVCVGTLVSLLVVVMNVGAAGIVFHEAAESDSLHALSGGVADAVTICLLCTAVGQLTISLTSGCPALVSTDAFMGAFFVTMARTILEDHAPAAPVGTVICAIGACSAMQGLAFYLLGAARVGRAVQYVPTPVISGYLASIGYLLLNGVASMLTGCTLVQPACLSAAPAAPQLPLALAVGLALFSIERTCKGAVRTAAAPCVLAVATVSFQLAQAAADDPLDVWK